MRFDFRCDSKTAVVETDRGTVKGYLWKGLSIFKGIPYAIARRFHAPEPVKPWEGVFDAGSYGFVCPLLTADRPVGELCVPHRYWPMNEDCLNLNIWTPAADGGKRPVLVWLHGGGYEAGSSIEQQAYDGASLCAAGDTVVVSINHRLNILGYFDLSDYGEEYANSGNAGGDDIIAALDWVRRNIAAFGGDPENVTVFGQSGGGAKVTTLLQSPAADGLYARGVVMSGVIGPVLADAEGSGTALAEALLRELGITAAGAAGIREMEQVDCSRLFAAYRKVRPALEQAGAYVGCRPHPNAFYLGEPTVHGFRKETAEIPLLIGSVFGEYTSFTPSPYDPSAMSEAEQIQAVREAVGEKGAGVLLPLFRAAYPERQPLDLLRLDFIFRGPEIDYIAKRSRLNDCTWSYLFNMDQPINGANTPWHCCDIPYFFRNLHLVEYPHGPLADPELPGRLEQAMSSALLAFARSGSPAVPELPEWPACRAGAEPTMLLDAAPRVRENFDHDLIAAQAEYMGPSFRKSFAAIKETAQH